MLYKNVTIIGIGLIGSSLARNLVNNENIEKLCVYDINQEYLKTAQSLNIAHSYTDNLQKAVENADLIVFAIPVRSFANVAQQIAPFIKKGVVITDVGSVKEYCVAQLKEHLNESNGTIVIGGHPVAGTEKSGPQNGFATLFRDRWCILTVDENTNLEEVEKLKKLWQSCEMKVDTMSVEHHDKVMAAVSHLPQLIAYSIVGTVADLEGFERKEIIKYSAGGFRDFTRIAGSDPTMWRDIFLTNKKTVLELIQRFVEDLIALERNMRWDEGETMFDLFTRTQKIRKDIIEAKQDQPEREKRILEELEAKK